MRKTLTLEVTQADIAQATRDIVQHTGEYHAASHYCPIAQALRRIGYDDVHAGLYRLRGRNTQTGATLSYEVTAVMRQAIRSWDRTKTFAPRTFTLNHPVAYLGPLPGSAEPEPLT